MKSSLFFLFATIAIVSCTKDIRQPLSVAQPSKITLDQYGVNLTPSNPVNPYDSVGRMHNAGLDYIARRKAATGDSSAVAINHYLIAFCRDSLHVGSVVISPAPHPLLQQEDADELNRVIGALPYTPIVKGYIHHLTTLAFDSVATGDENAFKGHIISFENTVLKDNRLSAADRKVLLSASSVARYSAAYWMGKARQKSGGKKCWFCNLLIWPAFVVVHDITGTVLTGGLPAGIAFSEFAADFLDAAAST